MSKTSNSPKKRILVTGGCGYLGAQLIRDIANKWHSEIEFIRLLDNFQKKNYKALMNLPNDFEYQFFEGDILDRKSVNIVLQDIDLVIHLAAIVSTPLSFDNPGWINQVNHWGTSNLIEACLENKIYDFIYSSSIAVYGPSLKSDENDICRPLGPYASSKYSAEKEIITSTRRGLKPVILRFGTIYGYSDCMRYDALINRFAYLAGTGRPLIIYGDGEQKRPIISVRDASSSILFVMKNWSKMEGQIYNITSENPTVNDVAELIKNILPEIKIRYTEQDILTHYSFTIINDKIKSLGWSPHNFVSNGLREIIEKFQNIKVFKIPTIEIE